MRESIRYLLNKIKLIGEALENKDVFVVLLIVLTSFTSFGLGRLSKIDELKTPLQINNSALVQEAIGNKEIIGKYVASKSGSKYHLPWCSGAQTISEKNKIWFENKEEAESRGYTPAKNCKGI
ncbi:hypothetical protein KKC45_01995 [Patescibacteria group bacterium]|nr:hypothetical protein [Patescibacteria group bacterium]